MTKKHIWAKLLIVALIVAMVCAFFIGCKKDENKPTNDPCTNHVDANGDGKCDNCGATVSTGGEEEDKTVENLNALLDVIDDAIVKLGGIENVGNLGTDAFIELAMDQNNTVKKIRIDLDLSLDLLPENNTGYANNGFGFTVSAGEGNDLERLFGVWYVDQLENAENFVYLSAGGQNLKIDALTLASVLEKYNVNANVEVGSKLEGVSLKDLAGQYVGMVPMLGIKVSHETKGNQEVFGLNIRDLFKPQSATVKAIDTLLFGDAASGAEPVIDFASILKDLGLTMTSVSDIYDSIPDIALQVIGNYDANKKFESIGIGLDVAGSETGIILPGKTEPVIEAFPATNLSATLGFKVLTGDEAFQNVDGVFQAATADTQWNEIGVLNFAFKGQLSLGKTADTAKTYNIELSADINAAAVAEATFTKRVYYKNSDGTYYTENGAVKYTDWFYLRDTDYFADGTRDMDVIDALLPAINSLYIKMVNVDDPNDILLINLDEKISMDAGFNYTGGKMTIKLSAITDILSTFGVTLPDNVSNMISKLEGEKLPIGDLLGAIKPVLAGFIYKGAPAGTTPTTVAPAAATAGELNMAEAAAEPSILDTIMSVIEKIKACVTIGTDSITAKGSGADYTIGDAVLDFDMTAKLLRNSTDVNGVEVKFNNPLKLDYQANIKAADGETVIGTDKVLTVINVPYLQIGGTGNLFKAAVSVTQDKDKTYTNPDEDHKNSSSDFAIYVAIDLEQLGYGCATRTPVVLENGAPTSSIFTNVGWSISKSEVK